MRKITILGFTVEVYERYMYPSFNGNAEFKVSKKGYKELSRYLRNIIWMQNLSI